MKNDEMIENNQISRFLICSPEDELNIQNVGVKIDFFIYL